MSEDSRTFTTIPPEQQAIRTKCFHPTGKFEEFPAEDIERSIPERFEKIVQSYPDRLAIRTKNHEITYDQLNQAANRVAHSILGLRTENNEPVPILFQSDASVFPATLGVWKAGKIHVQIDPLLPSSRIAHLLETLQVRVVIANRHSHALVKQLVGDRTHVINIDELHAGVSAENPGMRIAADSTAWIRFTSGSTGEPKGVIQTQRNVLHYVRNFTNMFRVCSDDRLIMPHFRTTATPYQCALLIGASCHPLDVKMEGMNELIRWMIDQSVTIYSSNPTIFRHLLDSLNNQDELPQLRLINLDGESLSRMEVERYKTLFPDNCILVNRFGSGETGTVRVFFMDKQTRIVGDLVPTGYAIDDTEILIVNEDGEVVMTNEVGEISVRGRYLTPGYWQRPDLTEAQFSPNQFGEETRTYYTGDIGRIHRDGCLEHLGRKDFQVKIRGFKVEVSEVEAALLAIESIKEAVVTGRNYRVNEKRLVAYIVPTGNPLLSIGAIRRVLLEKLPDYMIPSSFVILDALPLTATGKVNRKTLPDPGTSRPELDSPYVAPKTPVEKELSKIWSEVLSVDQVGVEDSFFDLGGDSLSATRVVSHVMRTFQLDLPLRSLFQSPTVAEMANVIAKYQGVKLGEADIAEILTELESLSDGEVQQLLADPGMTKKSCAIPQ